MREFVIIKTIDPIQTAGGLTTNKIKGWNPIKLVLHDGKLYPEGYPKGKKHIAILVEDEEDYTGVFEDNIADIVIYP